MSSSRMLDSLHKKIRLYEDTLSYLSRKGVKEAEVALEKAREIEYHWAKMLVAESEHLRRREHERIEKIAGIDVKEVAIDELSLEGMKALSELMKASPYRSRHHMVMEAPMETDSPYRKERKPKKERPKTDPDFMSELKKI